MKNIFITSLDYDLTKEICSKLSLSLDMFYMDVKDLINYSLQSELIKEKIGVEYLDNQIKKTILRVCSYENTIANVPYDMIVKNEIFEKLNSNAVTILLNISNNQLIENNKKKDKDNKLDVALIVYDEMTNMLKDICQIVVNVDNSNLDNIVKRIIDILNNI